LLKERDLFKAWYNPNKEFKTRPSGEYPTNLLRMSYQYGVVMLCRLYGELDASKFTLNWEPLVYYIVGIRSTFNWDDILLESLEDATRAVKETTPGKFPRFHMSSYLLEMVCVYHEYPKIGWEWQPIDLPIHIYCKVIWEHKYKKKYHNFFYHFLVPLF